MELEGERNGDGLINDVWDVGGLEGNLECLPNVFVDLVKFVSFGMGRVSSMYKIEWSDELGCGLIECHLVPSGTIWRCVCGGTELHFGVRH